MTTFIIVFMIAAAIEASRRYFIHNKYCKARSTWADQLFSFCFIVFMVRSCYLHHYLEIMVLWTVTILLCGFILVIYAASVKTRHLESGETVTNKQAAIILLSWLVPLIIALIMNYVLYAQYRAEIIPLPAGILS